MGGSNEDESPKKILFGGRNGTEKIATDLLRAEMLPRLLSSVELRAKGFFSVQFC